MSSGRIWVSVRAGDRRADLALPAAVPVAELTPELATVLGASGGLAKAAGEPLDPARPLGEQVADGDLLVLDAAAVTESGRVRVYDDPADALAAVAAAGPSWGRSHVLATAAAVGAAAVCAAAAAAWAGQGVLPAAGVLAAVGLLVVVRWGPAGLPLVVAGGVLACVEVLAGRLGVDRAALYVVLGVLATLLAGAVPGAALSLCVPHEVPAPVPLDRLGRGLAATRRLSVALLACAGTVLVLAAAHAPVLDPVAGSAAVACCAVLAGLRARRYHWPGEILACVGGGLAPAVVLTVVLLAVEPSSWPYVAATAISCAGVAALWARSPPRSVVAARLFDVAETLLVLAAPMLLVWATGVPALVRSAS